MKYTFTLISVLLLSLKLIAASGPTVYKRVNSQYHKSEIVIAYNLDNESYKLETKGLIKDSNLNFGGVDVQVYKSTDLYLAYIHIGAKSAWTYYNENDNMNTIIRELIVVAYNNQ